MSVSKKLSILFFLMLAVTLVGSMAAQDETTITVWLPDSTRWMCTGDQLIPEFNEQNPNVNVEVSYRSNYEQSLRTVLIGGMGPDIFQTEGPDQAVELASGGLLLPLDDFVSQYGWDQSIATWALDLGKGPDGSLITIPAELETLVLYYNSTVFEENGWVPPNTIDEMMELAAEIEAAGVTPFAAIGLTCTGCFRWYIGEFFNSVAGPDKVYQALTGEIPWTDQAFVDSITLLNQIVQNGWMMGSVEQMFEADWDRFTGAFARGEAAMSIEGTWFFGRQGDFFGEGTGNDKDFDWVPMPTVSGEDVYTIGLGSTWSVNSRTANSAAVGEFLNWYLSPEIQARQLVECGTTPAPVLLSADMLAGVDPRLGEIFAALSEASAAGNYGYTMWTFWPAQTNAYSREGIQKVWTGDITVEEFLTEFNNIFAQELESGEVPLIPAR